MANILDLPVGREWGPFVPVETSNGVRLDFATVPEEDLPFQHYCFLVPEEDVDGIVARLRASGVRYQADPHGERVGEINENHGGRGVYFFDPAGHGMEVITQPYGADLQ